MRVVAVALPPAAVQALPGITGVEVVSAAPAERGAEEGVRPLFLEADDVPGLVEFVARDRADVVVLDRASALVEPLGALGLRDHRDPGPRVGPLVAALRERLASWPGVLVLAAQFPLPRPLPRVRTDAVPSCQPCSACCFSAAPHVRLREGDAERMGAEAVERLTGLRGGARFMRLAEGRCAALTAAGGRYACSIYARRPEACRGLERGDRKCEAARREWRFARGSAGGRGTTDGRGRLLDRAGLLEVRPGIHHGFSDRRGGDLGPGAAPDEQRGRWRALLGELEPTLAGAAAAGGGGHVVRVEGADGSVALWPEAGALVTTRPGLALAVLVSDDVPVLIAAPGGVAAVAVSWQGAVDGILGAAVVDLCRAAGAEPPELAAALGPHASFGASPVDEEVVAALRETGLAANDLLRRPSVGPWHLDLAGLVERQLLAAGVAEIERSSRCTRFDAGLFSRRRDGPQAGLQAGLIALASEGPG